MEDHAFDYAALGWAVFAWLLVLTGAGAFFMGQLFERVKSHSRRLDDKDHELSEVRAEQTQIATAFAGMKVQMDETLKYSVAIWRKLAARDRDEREPRAR